MRPGGGKEKGNSFEALVAKKLSAALPLNFIRSPGSGSRVGGKNFEKVGALFGEDALKIFTADVVPVNERQQGLMFLYSIECKSYATPDSFTGLVAGSANAFKWFEEAMVDAVKVEKQPMLIFKWNRTPIFVAVSSQSTQAYKVSNLKPKLTLLRYDLSPGSIAYSLDIFEFDELLKHRAFWVKPTT